MISGHELAEPAAQMQSQTLATASVRSLRGKKSPVQMTSLSGYRAARLQPYLCTFLFAARQLPRQGCISPPQILSLQEHYQQILETQAGTKRLEYCRMFCPASASMTWHSSWMMCYPYAIQAMCDAGARPIPLAHLRVLQAATPPPPLDSFSKRAHLTRTVC